MPPADVHLTLYIISHYLLENSIWMSHGYFVVKTKLIFFSQLIFTVAGGTMISPCHQETNLGIQLTLSPAHTIHKSPNSSPLSLRNYS